MKQRRKQMAVSSWAGLSQWSLLPMKAEDADRQAMKEAVQDHLVVDLHGGATDQEAGADLILRGGAIEAISPLPAQMSFMAVIFDQAPLEGRFSRMMICVIRWLVKKFNLDQPCGYLEHARG